MREDHRGQRGVHHLDNIDHDDSDNVDHDIDNDNTKDNDNDNQG